MNKYFVSYSYTSNNKREFGFGNCQINRNKIKNYDDINAIKNIIQEQSPDLGNVIILNIQKLPI